MKHILTTILIAAFLFVQLPTGFAHKNNLATQSAPSAPASGQIEPNAGNWQTWVISSGRDYRVPPPPGPAETHSELRSLVDLISQNDQQTRQQIAFWDAGAPPYRWIDLINSRLLAGTATTAYPQRGSQNISTIGVVPVNGTTTSQLQWRCQGVPPIPPSILLRRRLRRRCSLTSCLPRQLRLMRWPSKQDGRACSPACNFRAITTLEKR